MSTEYPGKAERLACAGRMRTELIEAPPVRPLDFRGELRVAGMLSKCELCRACPLIIRALTVMLPVREVPVVAQMFKLAS